MRRQTLGDLLRRTAARAPSKTAIVCGEVNWTYAEFDLICNRLANGLGAQGVSAGDRVAILSRNSHAFAALRFAAARLGAVLVPINFMLKTEEVAYILKSSGASLLAVGPEFLELGRDAVSRGTSVRQIAWLPGEQSSESAAGLATFDALMDASGTAPPSALDARMLAQIVYTSGMESLPKGAMLTHEVRPKSRRSRPCSSPRTRSGRRDRQESPCSMSRPAS